MKRILFFIFFVVLFIFIEGFSYNDLVINRGKIIEIQDHKIIVNVEEGICKGMKTFKFKTEHKSELFKNLNKKIKFIFISNGDCTTILKILPRR